MKCGQLTKVLKGKLQKRKRKHGNLEVILKIPLKRMHLSTVSQPQHYWHSELDNSLQLGTGGGQIWPVDFKSLSSIPDFYPLDASINPLPGGYSWNYFHTLSNVSRRTKSLPFPSLLTESPWFCAISCEGNMTLYESSHF